MLSSNQNHECVINIVLAEIRTEVSQDFIREGCNRTAEISIIKCSPIFRLAVRGGIKYYSWFSFISFVSSFLSALHKHERLSLLTFMLDMESSLAWVTHTTACSIWVWSYCFEYSRVLFSSNKRPRCVLSPCWPPFRQDRK